MTSFEFNGTDDGEKLVQEKREKKENASLCEFWATFSKPAKIYTYLGLRHREHPLFLRRNLKYMRRKKNSRNAAKCGIKEFLKNKRMKSKDSTSDRTSKISLRLLCILLEEWSMLSSFEEASVDVYMLPINEYESNDVFDFDKLNESCYIGQVCIPINVFSSDNSFNSRLKGFKNEDKLTDSDYSDVAAVSLNCTNFHSVVVVMKVSVHTTKSRAGNEIANKNSFKNFNGVPDGGNFVAVFYLREIQQTNCENAISSGLYEISMKTINTADEVAEERSALVLYVNFPSTSPHGININNTRKLVDFEKKKVILPSNLTKSSLIYKFKHGNVEQSTKASIPLLCVFCQTKCVSIDCLLQHLTTCHDRFSFKLSSNEDSNIIQVKINEKFDGSCVIPYLKIRPLHSTYYPIKRSSYSEVIACKKCKISSKVKNELRANAVNCNRTFYHTDTCMPIRPRDLEYDSDDDLNPDWVRRFMIFQIQDFSDVNDGEKTLMIMWNDHIDRHKIIADSQIPGACLSFLEEHLDTLKEKNICRNCVLHFINLYNYGLLNVDNFISCLQKINLKNV